MLTRHITLLEARCAEQDQVLHRAGLRRLPPPANSADAQLTRGGRTSASDPVLFRFAGAKPAPMKQRDTTPLHTADQPGPRPE